MEGGGPGVSQSGEWWRKAGEREEVADGRFVTTKRTRPTPSLNEVHGGATGERELPGSGVLGMRL